MACRSQFRLLKRLVLMKGVSVLVLLLSLGVCFAQSAHQKTNGSGSTSSTNQRVQSIVELLKNGHEQEAVNLLSAGLRDDPENQPMNALLGQVLFSRKDYSNAVAHFRKSPDVLAVNPRLTVN